MAKKPTVIAEAGDTETSFGALLRQYRVAAELSQEALAERAHMSARGISDLERGVRSKPYRGTVDQLAAALGLNAAERSALEDAARRMRDTPPVPVRTEIAPLMDALLTTKLAVPPAGMQLVDRPQLLDRLEAGVRGPLTLLAAPAGCGKTTLLSACLASPTFADRRVGWVSLDARDNEPVRFWRYVIAALDAAGVDVGADCLGLLRLPRPDPIEVVVTNLLNVLSTWPDDIIVVLDDFHVVDHEPIHRGLSFLLEHLPPQLHLVLSTRIDPPLPLARLRAGSRITEVRIDDLRFSRTEAVAFLTEIMGLALTPEEIDVLEDRTEGWIVGLKLAALSLQGRQDTSTREFITSFAGSHRHVIDYLTDEVLARQSGEVQRFLLHTSILDRLSASVCAFVIDEETTDEAQLASRDMLEALERGNLFLVALDDQREWYRYHHLFAEAVHHRFRQFEPDREVRANRRASTWWERHGFIQEATEHALDAEDFERAAGLIEHIQSTAVTSFTNMTLWRFLDRLPNEVMVQHPILWLIKAWFLLRSGQREEGERWLDTVETALQSHAGQEGAQNLQGEIAAARGFAASFRGDAAEVVAWTEAALRDLDRSNVVTRALSGLTLGRAYMAQGELERAADAFATGASVIRRTGYAYAGVRAMFGQSQMERAQGHLSRAMETCRQAIAWSAERGHPYPGAGILQAALADMLRERNQLELALQLAQEGVDLCRHVEHDLDLDAHVFALFTLARIEQARGHLDTTLGLIRQTQELVRTTEPGSHAPALLQAYEAQLWLLQDNLPAALGCAEKVPLDRRQEEFRFHLDFFVFRHELVPIIPIQVLIAQGQAGDGIAAFQQALALLELEVKRAGESGLLWLQIKTRIMQAVAYHSLGDRAGALVPLEQALALGRPEGYVRVFADEQAPVAALLGEILAGGTMQEYIATILSAIHPTQ